MNPAFDLSTVRRLLTHGINAGHWTLSDLDQPPSGWAYCNTQAKRIHGFTPSPYRNLLRDDAPPSETVQLVNPRDFDVAATSRPNKGQPDLDVQPLRWPDDIPLPSQRHPGHLPGDQDARADGPDHGPEGHLGASGQYGPLSPRALCSPSLEPGDYLQDPDQFDF